MIFSNYADKFLAEIKEAKTDKELLEVLARVYYTGNNNGYNLGYGIKKREIMRELEEEFDFED